MRVITCFALILLFAGTSNLEAQFTTKADFLQEVRVVYTELGMVPQPDSAARVTLVQTRLIDPPLQISDAAVVTQIDRWRSALSAQLPVYAGDLALLQSQLMSVDAALSLQVIKKEGGAPSPTERLRYEEAAADSIFLIYGGQVEALVSGQLDLVLPEAAIERLIARLAEIRSDDDGFPWMTVGKIAAGLTLGAVAVCGGFELFSDSSCFPGDELDIDIDIDTNVVGSRGGLKIFSFQFPIRR